jgi:hypothetical protein
MSTTNTAKKKSEKWSNYRMFLRRSLQERANMKRMEEFYKKNGPPPPPTADDEIIMAKIYNEEVLRIDRLEAERG